MSTGALSGTVRIVGAGLLGTSIGLALSKRGIDVVIEDAVRSNQALAVDYGAGRVSASDDSPILIVVSVPPDVTAEVVAKELETYPDAIVTDVASVKTSILQALQASNAPLDRYVGSHPMAGREKGGAVAGRADLFAGRPWVLTPNSNSSPEALDLTSALAETLGAQLVRLNAAEHDRAVALVSHVPQLVASLLAGRLVDSNAQNVALAGQGLRDTTRIAASDPNLWLQIIEANHTEILAILKAFAIDLDQLIRALGDLRLPGALSTTIGLLEAGNEGVARIPGKHGSKATEYAQIIVMIDDTPGELARLLTQIGEAQINLEDLKLEHSPGAQIGLTELYVHPDKHTALIDMLQSNGWRIAG